MNKGLTDTEFERLFERAVIQNFEDMLDAIPPREELEKLYPVTERHKARMEKMFRQVRRMDALESAVRWTRRIAATAAIMVAVFFGALFALSPGVRAAVSETIVQWFEGFTKFMRGEHGEDSIEPSGWKPQYLPDGFAESGVLVMGDITQTIYENEEKQKIGLTVTSSDSTKSVNNDGINYRRMSVNSIDYYLFQAFDQESYNVVVWYKDGYSFELFSEISIEVLQTIALSVSR